MTLDKKLIKKIKKDLKLVQAESGAQTSTCPRCYGWEVITKDKIPCKCYHCGEVYFPWFDDNETGEEAEIRLEAEK